MLAQNLLTSATLHVAGTINYANPFTNTDTVHMYVCMYFLEIQACTPNPCQHGGICSTNEDRSFSCNCTGTMYTGTKCDTGLVNIPDYPHLAMSTPYNFTATASPDEYLEIFVFPDDKSSLTVSPNQLQFNKTIRSNNFTITSTRSGRFLLNYRLSGESASSFMQLHPSSVIVIENQIVETDNSYFSSKGLKYGLLQPGCCTTLTSVLAYQCPLRSTIVKFNASCGWNLKELYSPGIIFSDSNGLGFPIAIGGVKFGLNFDLSNLNAFELTDACMPCSGEGLGKVANNSDPSLEEECSVFKPSIYDVVSFLESESLAYTYFHYSHQLLPHWLRFNVSSTTRVYTSNSYKVTLVESSEMENLELCNFATTHTNGLYSVLIYSGRLILSIYSEEVTYIPESDSNTLCFAVNLCEGKISPLSISISNDASNALKSLKIFKGRNWNVNFNSISISSSTIPLQQNTWLKGIYWNGLKNVAVNMEECNVILNVEMSYSSSIKDVDVYLSFVGTIYLLNDDIEKVLT